jgi:hypothetical protein
MKLGDVVRDKISGFRGVAPPRVEYLNGSVEWQITPISGMVGTNAQPVESREFDHDRLEFLHDLRTERELRAGEPPTW